MRACEIIQENRFHPDNMKHEVLTLLTSAAAEGVTQISPVNLLQDLKAMGYPMTMSGLYDLLQGEAEFFDYTPIYSQLDTRALER